MKNRIIRISPSIIATNYKNKEVLFDSLKKIEKAGANFVHLDVMDGKFVKNATFDYNFIEKVRDKTSLMLDVHLMVQKPEEVIDKYAKAGADTKQIRFFPDIHDD